MIIWLLIFPRFQDECFLAKSKRGAPRYFEGKEAIEKPRIRAIARWVVGCVLKKKIWDLIELIRVPEAFAKRRSKEFKAWAS